METVQPFSFPGLRGKERVLSKTQNKNGSFPENRVGVTASQGPSHREEARGEQLPASPLLPSELPPGPPNQVEFGVGGSLLGPESKGERVRE